MAFPETNLPIRVELSFDGSTWTDVSTDVRYENKITITRGRSDWGSQVDAGRCSFTLANTDGAYSPQNPEGPHYGQLGRNTPCRVSVNIGSVALDLPGAANDYATTPDAAALDITGDIDIRFDATLDNWMLADYPSAGIADIGRTELIGKSATSQVSWNLFVRRSRLYLVWSENGTTLKTATSTLDLPLTSSGRLAVRATLDVNNGASGHDVIFYTAPTMSGTWTKLGATVTGSGTTSIHSGTADLRIGSISTTAYDEAIGLVHAVQVLNGIGGSAVANPDFTAQASGTTSFADAAGRTWTLNGHAEITNRKTRFTGEVSSWPARWDTGGFDVVTDVQAAGVLRRLGIGAVPLKSPLYRELTAPARSSIVAYWPLEDGGEATAFASAFDGHPPMQVVTGDVTPAAYEEFVGADAVPTIDTGMLKATVPAYALDASTPAKQLMFVIKVPEAGVVSTQRIVSMFNPGTRSTWSLYVNTAGNLDLRAYDNEGVQQHASGFGTDSINGLEKLVVLQFTEPSSTQTAYLIYVMDIAASMLTAVPDDTLSTFTISNTVTGTTRPFTSLRFGQDGAMNGTALGHVALGNSTASANGLAGPTVGWNAEEAPSRVMRLGNEEGIHAYATGPGDEQMGVQAPNTALDLMRTAEQVDKGILAESRRILGVRYVTRASMYSQPVTLTLDYTGDDGLVAPLEPVDDDQTVTNDVTEQREGGASSRAVLTTGALSTAPPPAGIGLYDTSYTSNLLNDTQPIYHAGWRLHLGTWDEARFPQVTVNLATAPASIEAAAAVDVGSRLQITNPRVWLPPDTIDLLAQGYTETMDQRSWTITYNCTPYGPFNVAVEGDSTYDRADTEGSELAEALTDTETAVDVLTTSGPVWTTDSAEHPFPVRIAGEVVTVTDVDSWATDAFGRTTANGWGTADSGHVWSTGGGTSADFAVGSGYGSHTLATTNASRRSFTDFTYNDFDVYASITTSATATGGSLFGGLTGRYLDSSNFYTARVEFTTGNALVLSLRKFVAAAETQLATLTLPDVYSAGTYVRVRFQAQGSTLRAKAWLAGALEPGPWQVTVTDTSLTTSAFLGARSISATANTNVNPQVRYDNYEVVNPQTFTVTRSVNGVTKAQSAGADVRLAYPAYTAL
ncbi:hypothetical protein ABZY90_19520 [Streptomyces sp. NPDC006422]|uniref:hypothetical protein n=1 Tax=unclassified Streptomyces TaxID=2593676 RepID=UPI0033A26EE9